MPTEAEIEEFKNQARRTEADGKGKYLQAGKYRLQVETIFYKRSAQAGTVKESYIAEFQILESDNPDFPVGSSTSVVESTRNQGWDGRLKSMLLAIIGFDPREKTKEANDKYADLITAIRYEEIRQKYGLPLDFMRGKIVDVEAFPGTSVGKGTPIFHKKWTPVRTSP